MVVFILKNRSSLNHAVNPPKKITMKAVKTCIRLSRPVSAQSTPIAASRIGTKTSAATMKPVYSVPPQTNVSSRIHR